MTSIHEDRAPRAGMPRVWAGKFVNPVPTGFTIRARIVIPDMNPDLVFENVRWQSRNSTTLPVVGDKCLVIFDNNREPWIVAWWPYS